MIFAPCSHHAVQIANSVLPIHSAALLIPLRPLITTSSTHHGRQSSRPHARIAQNPSSLQQRAVLKGIVDRIVHSVTSVAAKQHRRIFRRFFWNDKNRGDFLSIEGRNDLRRDIERVELQLRAGGEIDLSDKFGSVSRDVVFVRVSSDEWV